MKKNLSKMLLGFTGVIALSGIGIYVTSTSSEAPAEMLPDINPPVTASPKPSNAATEQKQESQKGLGAESPDANPIAKSWHRSGSFSGSGNQHTNAFAIRGNQWRVNWSAEAKNEYCQTHPCTLDLFIKNLDDSDFSIVSATKLKGFQEGVTYQYAPGDFYFAVIGANLDSWNITIEDYY